MAVGYQSIYDDRPSHPAHPLVPAPWLETSTADGSIASTAEDMAAYLRMLLNHGRGIVSEESFTLMSRRVIESEGGEYYGYGLDSFDLDGHACIGHGGGMVGYASGLRGDLDGGFGVVALTNLTSGFGVMPYLFEVLRAAFDGRDLPPLPPASDPTRIDNAVQYAGRYRTGNRAIEIAAEADRLILRAAGETIVLEQRAPDQFCAPHAAFALFPLRFGRQADRVVEAFFGPDWYINERYTGPHTFEYPKEWEAYPGHYRSYNPWLPNFRIVLRKGQLALIDAGGEEKRLMPRDDGQFRVGEEEHSPERIRFDAIVDRQALRANYSGCDYYRAFTP
jgi:hypothetical protein